MRNIPCRLLILTGLYITTGILQASEIVIENVWVRAMPAGSRVSAAYASIINSGIKTDVLTYVESSIATHTILHSTKIHNNMAEMSAIDQLELPAGQTTLLQPGSIHIMLRNLNGTGLTPGTSVELLFHFRNALSQRIKAEVRTDTPSNIITSPQHK